MGLVNIDYIVGIIVCYTCVCYGHALCGGECMCIGLCAGRLYLWCDPWCGVLFLSL